MDIEQILADLREERNRIDSAIAALQGMGGSRRGRGRAGTKPKPGGRRISAAGKKRISEAAKRMWAERRAKTASAAPKKAGKGRRHMSAAARARIAAAQRARWAKLKRGSKPSPKPEVEKTSRGA